MHGTLSELGRPRHNPADVRTFWELVEGHQFVTGAEDMMISDQKSRQEPLKAAWMSRVLRQMCAAG